MNNSMRRIKTIALNYLGICLRAFIPIPFIVAVLSFFEIEQDSILVIAFLCSIAVIEWLHFKRENETPFLERDEKQRNSSSLDLFFRSTDPFCYGAIVAKADNDDLMTSQQLETKASKVYEWSGQ